jgi:hypothetical protein
MSTEISTEVLAKAQGMTRTGIRKAPGGGLVGPRRLGPATRFIVAYSISKPAYEHHFTVDPTKPQSATHMRVVQRRRGRSLSALFSPRRHARQPESTLGQSRHRDSRSRHTGHDHAHSVLCVSVLLLPGAHNGLSLRTRWLPVAPRAAERVHIDAKTALQLLDLVGRATEARRRLSSRHFRGIHGLRGGRRHTGVAGAADAAAAGMKLLRRLRCRDRVVEPRCGRRRGG